MAGPPSSLLRHLATADWNILARAERGPVRKSMQDAVAIVPDAPCSWRRCDAVAVFDGVGGMAHGGEAAHAAAESLAAALQQAHNGMEALAYLDGQVRRTGGATTVVLVLLPRDGRPAEVLWAGDSAAYVLDPEGGLVPLTTPDSEGGYLVQCLGLEGARPHSIDVVLDPGAAILLCTDGVDGVVGRIPLHELLSGPPAQDPRVLDRVFDAIAAAGAPDNAAIVLARRRPAGDGAGTGAKLAQA